MSTSQVSTPAGEGVREHDHTVTKSGQEPGLSKGSMIGSIVAGIAASTCCLGPLVLLTLGVSGSWIGSLSAMEPYRPLFIGITLIFLGLAFHKLYRVPQVCAADKPCAQPGNLHKQRIIFWLISIFVLGVMSFPWYGPYLLD